MKRTITLLLSLVLCFTLCSCKSKAATDADDLICSIGEVTSESGNAIQKAETAVDALSEKDCEQLEHLDELKSARARYDDLVDRDKAEQLIVAINNVKDNITLDSKDAIYAVRTEYNASNSRTKDYVTNYDDFEQAEKTLSNLMIEDAIAKINAIGTVSLKSETTISTARKAVTVLSVAEREKVSNFETLEKAAEKFKELRENQIREDQQKRESAKQSQTSKENTNPKADKRTINTNGKQVWKVYARSSELHFTGSFQGSGYFGIKILDSNQDFFDLVVNEIGDYIIDKTIYGLVPDEMYYIQIECTSGSWSCSWTGTYGR